ncbi:double-strand break repair helicase AddA [Halodurantibacterium flavum]|uniref:DNA 3'-5' helicase n=1 Tax=Halodurantibacterium flavum TaxID=1382802 RepID=A0ABW4S9E3_9RHOB
MIRDDASLRQVQAADPGGSTWLSANAGSGKTRVLTDRVARLLLRGVQPQRILCLTYTKAAASEMQNRLFRRLGEWAMLDDLALRAALTELGAGEGIDQNPDQEMLRQARRLFARAIETPGGLKIQTIHSFCASLLRRFPLEAGVTPQFTEMDDRAAALLRAEIVEDLADRAPETIDAIASWFTGKDLSALTAEIAGRRDALAHPLDAGAARALFDLPPDYDHDRLEAEVFLGNEATLLGQLVQALRAGGPNDSKDAGRLASVLDAPPLAQLPVFENVFLFGAKAAQPFCAKIGKFPTKATREALGPAMDRIEDFMRRVETARPRRIALHAAGKTHALHRFAAAFLPEYAARKARRGWLDFDDLILRAVALLTDPSVAQWVLFRLDGGVDHILVDEAQDTSPTQWQVIELLAQEFTAGQGARGDGRTIFVVGDKKQSIYSFQGADLRAFDRMRGHFGARLAAVDVPLSALTLEHSFRSSPAVLRLVDMTLGPRADSGLGGEVNHIPFWPDMPGRVDLWPVVPAADKPEDSDWFDPVDILPAEHHYARLARQIAREIRRLIDAGTRIPAHGGTRPMTEGDVLILVQRRSELFHQIIRACKAEGLAIAGADRLKLGGELAVRDLSALLAFLSTSEDELSLAAALRSPLFGWTEAQLYDLAQGRKGWLWEALRQRAAEFPDTMAILTDLRDQSDFLRPYDLLERVLTRHDGRRRLLARLGPEAEDGIDALLSQALAYERMDVPSLTGFLTWLATEEVEIKRQMDSAGNRIRVMTVHGAKGLEAPVVILPDTAERRPRQGGELLSLADGAIAWRVAADACPPALAEARERQRMAEAEENLRLLYVAMTRAQSWLIVCAAGEVKEGGDCWYATIAAGMGAAGAATLPMPDPADGFMRRLAHGDWPAGAEARTAPQDSAAALPDWLRAPLPALAEPPGPISPSDLGGAKALAGIAGSSEEEAKRRGRQLHLLLEHLPLHAPARWPDLARELLAAGEDGVAEAEIAPLLAEAQAVLANPELSFLRGAGALAEVDITAEIEGRRMLGTIDCLIVEPHRVLAVDYKSNATVPQAAADVPEGILRQMGAYAAALEQIYPDRRVETAILWTRTARLMPLEPDQVAAAFSRATTS